MRIHHLDCATMCPVGGRWTYGGHQLVSHVMVIETPADGLVLVDTGIGLDAASDPRTHLGSWFLRAYRPVLEPERTAVHRIRALGLDPSDVRHIVVTHLDVDHSGALADFPEAVVHVHGEELDAAVNPRTPTETQRYRRSLWAHGPEWRTYRTGRGEVWRGLESARPLDTGGGGDPDLVVIALAGHTRGHVGVAVRTDDRWIVHAGDAYSHTAAVHPERGPLPRFYGTVERIQAHDRHRMAETTARLAELALDDDVVVVCAHDPSELAVLAAAPVG